MATRQRKGVKADANGQYTRNLGWKRSDGTARYVQHKFYLGSDPNRRNAGRSGSWSFGSTLSGATWAMRDRRGTH